MMTESLATDSTAAWVQVGPNIVDSQDPGPNGPNPGMGAAVALSADATTVIVGNPFGPSGNGEALIFTMANGTWTPVGQTLTCNQDTAAFGGAVAISANGSIVAVGAQGWIEVYVLRGSTWEQMGQTITTSAPFNVSTVALDSKGSRLATGVKVLDFDGSTWVQVGDDVPGPVDNGFGLAVALDAAGERFVVGGAFTNLVRVFDFEGSAWVQVGADLVGAQGTSDFGTSVAVSGDGSTVAIGTLSTNASNPQVGCAQVYRLDDTNWSQVGATIMGTGNGLFGTTLALNTDGTRVAAGAPDGIPFGWVVVSSLTGSTWTTIGGPINGMTLGGRLGISVALSDEGQTVVAGAPGGMGGLRQAGSAHVYALGTQ